MDIEESSGMVSTSGELMTEKDIQETGEEEQDVLEPPEVSCPVSQDNTPPMDKGMDIYHFNFHNMTCVHSFHEYRALILDCISDKTAKGSSAMLSSTTFSNYLPKGVFL